MATEETKKKVTKAAPRAKKTAKKEEDAEKMTSAAVEESTASEEAVASASAKGGSFISAVGRRKTSIARVKLIKNGKGTITVNGRPVDEYFTTYEQRLIVKSPLAVTGNETAVDVSANVEGGGVHGQAESVRLGLTRALIVLNPTYRKTLKKLGFLTRDPRAKERKKFGLKRARRAPQWSKR